MKTKAKEAKAQTKENADPNVQKAAKPKKARAPKAKDDGMFGELPIQTTKLFLSWATICQLW